MGEVETRRAKGSGEQLYCDVVMKGGITSGIVYPRAITELAANYRFKGIGGASAGAIAAAVTAAAEFRRRHSERLDGFEALGRLPSTLSEPDPSDLGKRSRLFRLFRPQRETAPLFGVLRGFLEGGPLGGGRAVLWACRYHAALLALVFGAVALAAVWPLPSALALLPVGVVALVGAALGLVLRALGLFRALSSNGFGLCRGHTPGRSDPGELTDWLSRLINTTAGLPERGRPLTFGDLWDAPDALEPPVSGRKKAIDLRMMTTNATFGRPHVLPLENGDIFFRREELALYFPPEVVDHMVTHAARYEPSSSAPQTLPPGVFPLPAAADFPVVVAARLSLSFPFLVSAVPFVAVDYEVPKADRDFRRVWLSDGGVSSNFPIHFFDDLLPLWPTFGIKLENFPRGYTDPERDRVYMPDSNRRGYGDAWSRFDEAGSELSRLSGFFMSLVNAALDWNDNTLSRLPGFRDRIVRVRLSPNEGGMNLNMDEAKIARLSDAGATAGKVLTHRFVEARPEASGYAMGWQNHRWIRLRSLLGILEGTVGRLHYALTKPRPGDAPFADLIVDAARHPGQYPLLDTASGEAPKQTDTAKQVLLDIVALGDTIGAGTPTLSSAPSPLPMLRARPRE